MLKHLKKYRKLTVIQSVSAFQNMAHRFSDIWMLTGITSRDIVKFQAKQGMSIECFFQNVFVIFKATMFEPE